MTLMAQRNFWISPARLHYIYDNYFTPVGVFSTFRACGCKGP